MQSTQFQILFRSLSKSFCYILTVQAQASYSQTSLTLMWMSSFE